MHLFTEGHYTQALVWVAPGNAAARKEPTPGGHRKYQFYTSSHDYEALQTAPVWLDEPRVRKPFTKILVCALERPVGLAK